jgi:CHASE2 domain-containing sensor protein
VLGVLAGAGALTALVAFGAADAPNGRVAWVQIALGAILAGAVAAGLVRLRGERRTVLAGLLGAASAVASLGSLGVFRHGVVISLLPTAASRLAVALAVIAGVACAGTVFIAREEAR